MWHFQESGILFAHCIVEVKEGDRKVGRGQVNQGLGSHRDRVDIDFALNGTAWEITNGV